MSHTRSAGAKSGTEKSSETTKGEEKETHCINIKKQFNV